MKPDNLSGFISWFKLLWTMEVSIVLPWTASLKNGRSNTRTLTRAVLPWSCKHRAVIRYCRSMYGLTSTYVPCLRHTHEAICVDLLPICPSQHVQVCINILKSILCKSCMKETPYLIDMWNSRQEVSPCTCTHLIDTALKRENQHWNEHMTGLTTWNSLYVCQGLCKVVSL
jgi:hypothetical protein